jgi:serine/threonine-protein kinase HipA
MSAMPKRIGVYADWVGLRDAVKLGTLHAFPSHGKEIFDFAFDERALAQPRLVRVALDPRLQPFAGRHHPEANARNFGVFLDSSPDRWGRLLMQRRAERQARAEKQRGAVTIRESDYILGVHDLFRVGALRYALETGDVGKAPVFLADSDERAAPPFVRLRELEQAARAIEEGSAESRKLDEWLRILLAPGGSLGGARPKASVQDKDGQLWIAKFPSHRDTVDVGAWELVLQSLARRCELNVPPARAERFASDRHTFLVQRFDRTADGKRFHFASAMTLTGHDDGDDEARGVSYLEIAEVLIRHGTRPAADLFELWSRIVFNLCVSNADDHLRNHGFLLEPGRGWTLAPAYDMNPDPSAAGLKLNISESDNAMDLNLALSVAHLFRVPPRKAERRIEEIRDVTGQWRTVARAIGLSRDEQERQAPAFRLAL